MSDILIKNMELPKEDGLVIEITKHGQVAQLFKDGSLLRKGVKAIELPPHGELVEREKLIDDSLKAEMFLPDNIIVEWFQQKISSAPTILEAST